MFLCSPFRIRRQVGIDRGLGSFESNKETSSRSLLNFHSVQDAVVPHRYKGDVGVLLQSRNEASFVMGGSFTYRLLLRNSQELYHLMSLSRFG